MNGTQKHHAKWKLEASDDMFYDSMCVKFLGKAKLDSRPMVACSGDGREWQLTTNKGIFLCVCGDGKRSKIGLW